MDKPKFLPENCVLCGSKLILIDFKLPPEERWLDEWKCSANDCENSKCILMDWEEK